MGSIKEQIENIFFAYLTDRNFSNETKFANIERQRYK